MATFTTTDGVDLHYTDDGDGPVTVLIAGFCSPAAGWEFQRRALLAEGHRGRDSQLWPCEHAVAAAESNPLASVTILEDCGHAVHLDQIEATNAALLGFLK
jgi:pimeloyl-ACP methyl ester carboxylesterase